MLSKTELKMLEKLEKEVRRLKTQLDKGEVPSDIKVMGTHEVLPFDVQADILNNTRGFLSELENGRNGFKEQISHNKYFTRKTLVGLQKDLERFACVLISTFAAVKDSITMIQAELDSRDIGKEPSDSVLIKDEQKRCERFEKFKAKFAKKGKPDGVGRKTKRKNRSSS